ncbi:MAG: hypothetical protein IT303_00565 [Dehalococcoidia bacterium]|nr:hypothetical protein [Dehalococcoidia bacterium]
MEREVSTRRYRSEAAMNRGAAAMARDGWSLAGWRELGAGDGDEPGELYFAQAAKSRDQFAAHGAMQMDAMRATFELVKLVLRLPVVLIRGRERILAVYERERTGQEHGR